MLKIQLEAQKRNFAISIPTTEERYDLILDNGQRLFRVQVKYLNRKHSDGGLELLIGHSQDKKRLLYSKQEIDILLVYCPILDTILLFNSDDFHNKKTILINTKRPKSSKYYKNFLW